MTGGTWENCTIGHWNSDDHPPPPRMELKPKVWRLIMGSDPPPSFTKDWTFWHRRCPTKAYQSSFHDFFPLCIGIESKCLLSWLIALPTFSYHLELPGILSWSASRSKHSWAWLSNVTLRFWCQNWPPTQQGVPYRFWHGGGGQGFDGGDLCVIRDKIKGTKKMSVNLGLWAIFWFTNTAM